MFIEWNCAVNYLNLLKVSSKDHSIAIQLNTPIAQLISYSLATIVPQSAQLNVLVRSQSPSFLHRRFAALW